MMTCVMNAVSMTCIVDQVRRAVDSIHTMAISRRSRLIGHHSNECSYHSSHLISSDLISLDPISSELNAPLSVAARRTGSRVLATQFFVAATSHSSLEIISTN